MNVFGDLVQSKAADGLHSMCKDCRREKYTLPMGQPPDQPNEASEEPINYSRMTSTYSDPVVSQFAARPPPPRNLSAPTGSGSLTNRPGMQPQLSDPGWLLGRIGRAGGEAGFRAGAGGGAGGGDYPGAWLDDAVAQRSGVRDRGPAAFSGRQDFGSRPQGAFRQVSERDFAGQRRDFGANPRDFGGHPRDFGSHPRDFARDFGAQYQAQGAPLAPAVPGPRPAGMVRNSSVDPPSALSPAPAGEEIRPGTKWCRRSVLVFCLNLEQSLVFDLRFAGEEVEVSECMMTRIKVPVNKSNA